MWANHESHASVKVLMKPGQIREIYLISSSSSHLILHLATERM